LPSIAWNNKGFEVNVYITSPYDDKVIVKTISGLEEYFSNISELSYPELCIELSNVMASKHNHMILPATSGDEYKRKQEVVTDLTDRQVAIFLLLFGRAKILEYSNRDLRMFNKVVNEMDAQIANMQLGPERHGAALIEAVKTELVRADLGI
jgi:hypothetical protein